MRPTNCIEIVACFVAAAFAAAPALGQDYPTKPVRIIAGSAGAMPDIVTRHLAQRLSERWGQPVVVENRPVILISATVAAKAPADGYTLLMADRTSHAVAPSLFKNLAYDPIRDFEPIALVARAALMLVVHPSVPAASLREFIAYAKQRPGALDFASAGPGTAAHVAHELMRKSAGIDFQNVHYKGGGAAMMAIVSGEAKAGFVLMPVALPQVNARRVKALAVSGTARFAGAPDVPTAAEAGLPGYEADFWIGMFAPAHTPVAILAKLNRDIVAVMQTGAMRETLLVQGAEPAAGTPAEFVNLIASETAKLKKLIEDTGMRVD